MRGTRDAVGNNFLGSLESFLVYLETLVGYCELFLEDAAAEAAMKARWRLPRYIHIYIYITRLQSRRARSQKAIAVLPGARYPGKQGGAHCRATGLLRLQRLREVLAVMSRQIECIVMCAAHGRLAAFR